MDSQQSPMEQMVENALQVWMRQKIGSTPQEKGASIAVALMVGFTSMVKALKACGIKVGVEMDSLVKREQVNLTDAEKLLVQCLDLWSKEEQMGTLSQEEAGLQVLQTLPLQLAAISKVFEALGAKLNFDIQEPRA